LQLAPDPANLQAQNEALKGRLMNAPTDNDTKFETGLEDAAERVRELNERVLASTKKAGAVTVDTYDSALHTFADYTEKIGAASPIEWVSTITRAQADLTRDLTTAYTKAARTLLV
jgi:hypothetical protein